MTAFFSEAELYHDIQRGDFKEAAELEKLKELKLFLKTLRMDTMILATRYLIPRQFKEYCQEIKTA
jgi:hypothetical protein